MIFIIHKVKISKTKFLDLAKRSISERNHEHNGLYEHPKEKKTDLKINYSKAQKPSNVFSEIRNLDSLENTNDSQRESQYSFNDMRQGNPIYL